MNLPPESSSKPDPPPWHALPAADALADHGVRPDHGLTEDEAAARLARHGPNRPSQQAGRSALSRFLGQLTEPLVLVLIGAGAVTAALGEWVDSSVIFGVVAINAVIGYLQEGKAEAALAALARAVATEVTVLRDGRRRRMDAVHLVPGDVVWLSAGDKVPADLRIISGRQLRTVEAALTGEAAPIDKHHDGLPPDTQLADRRNMAYAGTTVVAGQGHGLVVATGDATETGRISGLIASAPEIATPLTKKMGEFAGLLLWVILGLAALTFVIGVMRGEPMTAMLMAAVALAVGAIPEGLPAAMSITLAIGVSRMAKRRAIIRHLPAVEALGSTTVICSDKTGTLTENAMTVTELWAAGTSVTVTGHGYDPEGSLGGGEPGPALREVLIAAALCNDAALSLESRRWLHAGDPTEVALLVAARKGGLDETTLRHVFPRQDELPFDSARQTMATLHDVEGRPTLYAKGAIEKVLPAKFKLDSELIKVLALPKATYKAMIAERPKGFGDEPGKYHSDAIFLMEGLSLKDAVGAFDPREGVATMWPGKDVIYHQRLSAERTKTRLNKMMGSPAKPARQHLREVAALGRLTRRDDAGS
ncbi:HAD-IC family P-type ATPase, partial [Sulfuritalea sp.]|uniref:cation-translocating P-type ATPase n=1 Tax=Sulfuritalea sp. TaxID=2480090 RepID=UPI001AC01DEB